MLWVVLDRGLRFSDKRYNLPCPNKATLLATRDALYEDIMKHGFKYEMNTFVQSYESNTTLDSSVLIASLVFFIAPTDPLFLRTLDVILRSPEDGGLISAGFIARDDISKVEDCVGGKEGFFIMCTLWAIEVLTRAGKYGKKPLHKAVSMFEQVTNSRSPVGLLNEMIGSNGEHLGNTPQTFCHLAYVSADINLERAGGGWLSGGRREGLN